MYGIVNSAVQDLVLERHGDSVWAEVAQACDLDEDNFFQNHQGYPDELTYRLVGEVCARTATAPGEFLEALGEYWVRVTGKRHYGQLVALTGRSLPEVLAGINGLHGRVALTFPNYQPPRLWCSHVTADRLLLHYESTREGLWPFVVGAVKALAEMTREKAEARLLEQPTPGSAVFEVTWRPA